VFVVAHDKVNDTLVVMSGQVMVPGFALYESILGSSLVGAFVGLVVEPEVDDVVLLDEDDVEELDVDVLSPACFLSSSPPPATATPTPMRTPMSSTASAMSHSLRLSLGSSGVAGGEPPTRVASPPPPNWVSSLLLFVVIGHPSSTGAQITCGRQILEPAPGGGALR
jgi:hypothetical protein